MSYVNKVVLNGSEVQLNSLEGLQDAQGHNRFIEGDLTLETITGFTFTYGKWSLSGTHLMIVIAGTVDANTTLLDNTKFTDIYFPEWILEKIYPTVGTLVMSNTIKFYQTDASWVITEHPISLGKNTDKVNIVNGSGNKAFVEAQSFRMQFDLLIDND